MSIPTCHHTSAMRRMLIVLFLLIVLVGVAPAAWAGPSDVRAAPPARAAAVSGTQKWLTILCKFQDVAAEPRAKLYFEQLYTHAQGLDAYWREVSYNAINLTGSTVVGWLSLPQPRSYYVVSGHQDMDKTRADCTAAADPSVNFPDYAGITMMFNDDIDSGYYGITEFNTVTLDGVSKEYPFIWIDDKGNYNEALVAHEMAHALGLFGHPAVFAPNGDYVAGDSWDLLGGTCRYSTYDSTYRCIPIHLVAPSKDILGWIAPSRTFTATTGTSATITLEQLAQPGPANYLIAKIPIGGSATHFYSVEARRKVGFDNTTHFDPNYSVPGSAVLIHEVDLINFGASHNLIPADPTSGDPGGAGAMWTPGKTFTDATRRISVTVVAETASGFVVRIQNAPASMRLAYLPLIRR